MSGPVPVVLVTVRVGAAREPSRGIDRPQGKPPWPRRDRAGDTLGTRSGHGGHAWPRRRRGSHPPRQRAGQGLRARAVDELSRPAGTFAQPPAGSDASTGLAGETEPQGWGISPHHSTAEAWRWRWSFWRQQLEQVTWSRPRRGELLLADRADSRPVIERGGARDHARARPWRSRPPPAGQPLAPALWRRAASRYQEPPGRSGGRSRGSEMILAQPAPPPVIEIEPAGDAGRDAVELDRTTRWRPKQALWTGPLGGRVEDLDHGLGDGCSGAQRLAAAAADAGIGDGSLDPLQRLAAADPPLPAYALTGLVASHAAALAGAAALATVPCPLGTAPRDGSNPPGP